LKILITGSTSDIARYLAEFLRDKQYGVVTASSTGKTIDQLLDLNAGYSSQILNGVTHIIHCAINPKLILTNVEEQFIREVSSKKIQMIYIGSTSSHLKEKNRYGKYKNQVEHLVLSNNGTVITCGLIYGDRIFGQIYKIRKLLEFLPIGVEITGAKNVYLTKINNLSEDVLKILTSRKLCSGRFNCFDSDKIEFNQLLSDLGGKKKLTIKVRGKKLARLLDSCSVKLNRFDSDRLRGILSDFEPTLEI
jgi:nucleoside-diphosphate-sugar epimerase